MQGGGRLETKLLPPAPPPTLCRYTYERAAIESWLSRNSTSPLTNLEMADHELIPNLTLRKAMQAVLGEETCT